MSSTRRNWVVFSNSNVRVSLNKLGDSKFIVDKDHVDAPDELLADYADGNCVTDEDALVYLPDLKIDRPDKD